MILHAKRGHVFAADAFDRLIVQIDVRDFNALRQRIGLQRKTVVLRSDLDATGVTIQHRLIGSAMSEFQFVDFAGQCESQQLMSETNPEHRLLAEQSANRVDRIIQRPRVARPVREEHAVRIEAQHFVGCRGTGDDGDSATKLPQMARDVPLHAIVDRHDMRAGRVVGERLVQRLVTGSDPLTY